MVVPFALPLPTMWYLWILPIGRNEHLPKGLAEGAYAGFNINH